VRYPFYAGHRVREDASGQLVGLTVERRHAVVRFRCDGAKPGAMVKLRAFTMHISSECRFAGSMEGWLSSWAAVYLGRDFICPAFVWHVHPGVYARWSRLRDHLDFPVPSFAPVGARLLGVPGVRLHVGLEPMSRIGRSRLRPCPPRRGNLVPSAIWS
jgi:hypothetical protein